MSYNIFHTHCYFTSNMAPPLLPNAPTVSPVSVAKPHPPIPIVEEHDRHVLQVAIIVMGCMVGVLMFLCSVSLLIRFFYTRRYHIHNRNVNAPILFDLNGNPSVEAEDEDVDVDVEVVHPIWYIRTVGLEQSLIDSIAVFKYKKGEGMIDSSECSVCLGEFEEEESLRLLPKCTHAFHIPCIDTWLLSHQNCPLCRAPVALTSVVDDDNASATASSSVGVEEETQPLRTSLSIDSNSMVLDLDTHYCGHQPNSTDISVSVIDKHGSSTSPTTNNNLPSIGPHTLQKSPLSISMRTSFSHNTKFLFPRHSRSQSSTLPL